MPTEEEATEAVLPPAELQRRVLAYWEATGVPARALAGDPDGPIFRFTEGPPTANGVPHVGHLISRTLKDVHLRYHRMLGERIVSPMAGWDCHGLPVEIEIERRHGLRSKKEIEAHGIARFCEECRASTLEVADVWEEMSRRLGYWLDYRHPYLTMSPEFIESVWWSLKTLFDRGLLSKGYYPLPYCPRCETPLSSHEVAQGYRETTDPAVTVRFPLAGPAGGRRRYLLVWTTTPWTLPSNLLVAARADLAYVGVEGPDGSEEILAEAALPRYRDRSTEPIARYAGRDLEGLLYAPLFDAAGPGSGRYRVVLDPMVDPSEGTGLVHIAPSFGPEDQRIGEREGVGFFDPLDGRAVFTERVPSVAGKAFKAADPILLAELAARGLVERSGTLKHTYPFCWRCGHALIYRGIDSWFVRTRRIAEALVRHNASVAWVPSHLRDGRFGNFLGEAKDWALSRNRYWGTPLPIWLCPDGHATCVGSFAELAERSGRPLPRPFDPHRVSVDAITLACSTCGQPARREPYTIDGWYDSGAAPFAQFHHPFEASPFDPTAPLDFVAEGLDQTRGWFYTMLVLSTALFDRPAYTHCVVNGLALDAAGQKMSKSKGNAVDPMSLLEQHGGDAPRWACLVGDFTEPVRIHEREIVRSAHRTLGTVLNVAAFYRQNAEADRRPPATSPGRPAPKGGSLLDRWMRSRVDGTVDVVGAALADYDPRRGALALQALVDDLSTWYLRRSRPRFWSDRAPDDRREADETLGGTLRTIARLLAPFAPFTADYLEHEVGRTSWSEAEGSVHLQRWPNRSGAHDASLELAMAALRTEVELGRELRQRVEVKSRIPLADFLLVGPPGPLGEEGDRLIAEELNVRSVRRLAAEEAEALSEAEFASRLDDRGRIVALLSRRPTPQLLREGLVREALRRLQSYRKELGLSYLDRIRLELWVDAALLEALRPSAARLAEELLATSLRFEAIESVPAGDVKHWEIGELRLAARVGRSAPTGARGARAAARARPAAPRGRARPKRSRRSSPAAARRRTGGRPSGTSRKGSARAPSPPRRRPAGGGARRPRRAPRSPRRGRRRAPRRAPPRRRADAGR